MGYLGWILIFFSVSSSAFADDLLTQYCDRAGGEVVSGLSCDKRKIRWKTRFCSFKDPSDRQMFFNGCSGPTGGHSELFYSSCIKHDLCYHHEPATSGLSKSACDKNLRSDLIQACDQAKNRKYCEIWAHAMYEAVKIGGKMAYNCHNNVASYTDLLL